jgi:hypothetical protein
MEMHTPARQGPGYQVACSVCRQQVPMSEAMNAEASDYVAHFCGLDCFQRWLAASRTPGDDTF